MYVPPSQSRFYNDDELSKLENEIMSMCSSNKYVIISGDINARTGKLTDHVKLDNYFSDLFDFDEDMANLLDKTDILDNLGIPLTRSSMDKKTNTTGYWLIDQCDVNFVLCRDMHISLCDLISFDFICIWYVLFLFVIFSFSLLFCFSFLFYSPDLPLVQHRKIVYMHIMLL